MANQAPIKVSGETKERIRYLAALTDATQAEIVDRASRSTPRDTSTPSTRASTVPAWCSPAATPPSPRTFSMSQPKTSSASQANPPALTQAQPDHFPPANRACWPVTPDFERRVGETALQHGEQDVAQPIADVRAVRRPAAQRAPDLLHSPALQDQDTARKVTAELSGLFRSPLRQSAIHQLQQPGSQPSLQTDDCFRAIAQPVILRREQPPLRVKISEPGVRIIVRVLLAAMHRAQPH